MAAMSVVKPMVRVPWGPAAAGAAADASPPVLPVGAAGTAQPATKARIKISEKSSNVFCRTISDSLSIELKKLLYRMK